jgi:hypothetical protein
MMKKVASTVQTLREMGEKILSDRCGPIAAVSGRGVQGGTRFSIREDGKNLVCAVKVAAGDEIHRIHFPRSQRGATWTTLTEVDRVLYIRRRPGQTDQFEAQMHSKDVLLRAFDANYAHALKKGIDHLPAWLSPDAEEGDRFVGSGFGKDALWTCYGSIKQDASGSAVSDGKSTGVQPLTLQQAKNGLAAHFGVAPEAIEIIIRS